ncbi:MAG TPA: aminotransferase class IV family protein [Draconibacterium sp.]|nr:aminotransferase class IV family protein [Draconibacterium sp.]
MYPLLETIKCSDGKLCNMEFHQLRFEKSCVEYFGIQPNINLMENIEIPAFAKKGIFRCRVIYSKQIEKIEFVPHQYREIQSLKLIEDNEIDYGFKYADRDRLNLLFEKRGICDDIIIVKNGCITDSTFANIVFFDGRKWLTPDTPLLTGTQRAKLLSENKIFKCRITPEDIQRYKKIGLINAMQDLEIMKPIDIKNIHF